MQCGRVAQLRHALWARFGSGKAFAEKGCTATNGQDPAFGVAWCSHSGRQCAREASFARLCVKLPRGAGLGSNLLGPRTSACAAALLRTSQSRQKWEGHQQDTSQRNNQSFLKRRLRRCACKGIGCGRDLFTRPESHAWRTACRMLKPCDSTHIFARFKLHTLQVRCMVLHLRRCTTIVWVLAKHRN